MARRRKCFHIRVAALALALWPAPPARAAQPPRPVRASIWLTQASGDLVIMRQALETLFNQLSLKVPGGIQTEVKIRSASWQAELQKPAMDVGYSDDSSVYLTLRETGQYEALLTPMLFGSSKRVCLWVPTSSPLQSVKELRNKAVLMHGSELYFVILGSLLGQDPLPFLKNIQLVDNSMSAAIGLSLGQADAAVANEVLMDFMKLTNPGAVRKIRPLVCGPVVPIPPVFVKKSATAIKKALLDETAAIDKKPVYQNMKRAFRMTHLELRPASQESYDPLLRLIKTARAKGWGRTWKILWNNRPGVHP